MKIGIIGAGAMGSIVGARLAHAGIDTTLFDTWKDHRDVANASGLTVESDEGTITAPVKMFERPDRDMRFDIVIILVKAHVTREAATIANEHLAEGGAVISFQNGLGNEEIIAEVVGPERTLGGTLYFGGNVVSPGRVRHSNPKAGIAVGGLLPAGHAAATRLGEALSKAGFDCVVDENVLALKWQKALVNVGTNPLATILNLPNRQAGDLPDVRQAMIACGIEAIAVAKAKGIPLPGGDDPVNYVRQATDVHSYQHTSSMCLDLAAGRKTEVDTLNGAIASFGSQVGVPTPLNVALTAAIHRIELEMMRKTT
ncbi:ketopantoate reductase family protein [Rhizobium sp. SYY.PMSO]|uniref:ketopantoate reductase family protein n=1 Tax=Rhizobium sp. SYY.PMSO TaxID=3382192 RepID=UPI000DDD7DBC